MSECATSRPLRKDAARNRALLVQAGREVFAQRGLDASLDDVARHAGLGVGTAYRHFANKHELAQAIFADAVDRIIQTAQDAAALDDPWQGLVAFIESAAEAQTTDRGLRELLMGVHDPEEIAKVNERIREPLIRTVERAKRAGAVRPDVQASDIGVAVLLLCTIADVTTEVAPGHWRRYLPMLLDGLRSGSAPPVPALSDDDFFQAISSHKQRMAHATKQTVPACDAPPAAASG
jgi:AcrR family transcriptional regulator